MVRIYYDGDCPFCTAYTSLTELRSNVGEVKLLNLRDEADEKSRLQSQGLDVDQGMVVEFGGNVYHGSDAVNLLAVLSTGNGAINRISKLMFSHPTAARIFYPVLVLFRNITLFLLGKEGLNNDSEHSGNLQVVFNVCLGIFSCLHLVVYATQFSLPLYWSTWAIPIIGLALIVRPTDSRIFLLLIVVMAIDGVRQMPTLSNHTIIKNFLVLSVLWAFFYCCRKSNLKSFFSVFAPTGRSLLVVMYFFGVFHKINSDFLDPAVSCAVALWQRMPASLAAIDSLYAYHIFIYGTLIIETVILFLLFGRNTRHWGILFGVFFHSILGVSGYAFFPPFSTLTVVLHLLFVSPEQADRIVKGRVWQNSFGKIATVIGFLMLIVWLSLIGWLASNTLYSSAALIWLVFPLALVLVLWTCKSNKNESPVGQGVLRSSSFVLNLIAVLFFVNGWMPYFGLKTAQSMNMFANLQLENGQNNHLLMKYFDKPFEYLDDVVFINEVQQSEKLTYHRLNNLPIVYHDMLAELVDNPEATVSYSRGDTTHAGQNSLTLKNEIDRVVLPEIVRGYFHFTPVDLTVPKPCALNR